jgi:hypothetical protein
VMRQPKLLPLVEREVGRLMNGYIATMVTGDGFITLPALGARSGVLGAIALAETL